MQKGLARPSECGGYRFNQERFLLGEHRSQIENQSVVGFLPLANDCETWSFGKYMTPEASALAAGGAVAVVSFAGAAC